MNATTKLRSFRSTDALEARDTTMVPLVFVIQPERPLSDGDPVTVVSSTGDTFIGHVTDVDHLHVYVELD